jgi:allantoinase
MFHAELEKNAVEQPEHSTHYSVFLHSRPQKFETDAVSLITKLQQSYPSLRCHIVHLSASSALPIIRTAKASGLSLTVETCFHYLCLASERIPDGRPDFKCAPPIREERNRELLWAALKEGLIDFVVSDHSPCIRELKNMDSGDIMGAWGGISTLGLGLSLLWNEEKKRGLTIAQIIDWTSVKTAKHAGLSHIKGQLKVGYDADVIIWNPEAEFKVRRG